MLEELREIEYCLYSTYNTILLYVSLLTCRFIEGLETGQLVPPKASMLIASRFAEESETIAAISDVAIVPALRNEYSAMDIAGVESEHMISELESYVGHRKRDKLLQRHPIIIFWPFAYFCFSFRYYIFERLPCFTC